MSVGCHKALYMLSVTKYYECWVSRITYVGCHNILRMYYVCITYLLHTIYYYIFITYLQYYICGLSHLFSQNSLLFWTVSIILITVHKLAFLFAILLLNKLIFNRGSRKLNNKMRYTIVSILFFPFFCMLTFKHPCWILSICLMHIYQPI